MKRTLTWLIAAGAVTSLLMLGLVPKKHGVLGLVSTVHAQAGCSPSTLQGDYLVTGGAQASIDQSDDPTFPRVALAVHIFDGKGVVTGFTTMSHGGEIIENNNLQAFYTLDSDCKGTLTFPDANWRIVITRDGREGAYIRTDPGTIATRYIKKR